MGQCFMLLEVRLLGLAVPKKPRATPASLYWGCVHTIRGTFIYPNH